jgi:hypothetical protein
MAMRVYRYRIMVGVEEHGGEWVDIRTADAWFVRAPSRDMAVQSVEELYVPGESVQKVTVVRTTEAEALKSVRVPTLF